MRIKVIKNKEILILVLQSEKELKQLFNIAKTAVEELKTGVRKGPPFVVGFKLNEETDLEDLHNEIERECEKIEQILGGDNK